MIDARSTAAPSVTSVAVVICTHSMRRWAQLGAAVESVRRQRRRADEIVVVVDHDERLLERAAREFRDAAVLPNTHRRGLSGARNSGVERSSADVIAFLDDDATAEPDWLDNLLLAYADPRVAGVGGSASPLWPGVRPAWFPAEFDWVVGCAYTGMPVTTAPVRNPLGVNMSFRRCVFERAGMFAEHIGRAADDRMGCEETEFSIRVARAIPGSIVVFTPDARVRHRIAAERVRPRYFLQRCYAEGRSKARVSRVAGARDALRSERVYTRVVLPAGMRRGLRRALRGDGAGLLQATAIGAGLACTAAGYARGWLAAAPEAAPHAPSRPA